MVIINGERLIRPITPIILAGNIHGSDFFKYLQSTIFNELTKAIPEKKRRCMPIIGNQSIGEPPTSMRSGKPRTAPPNPSPVLTKPIHTKMSAIDTISNEENTIISNDALWD